MITAAAAIGLMCGCKADLPFTGKPDFNSSYTVNAEINCDELKAVSEITRTADKWVFTFTQPDTLAGVTLEYTENDCGGELGGLSFDAEKSPEYTALPDLIRSAVCSLSGVSDENISESDGVMTIDTDFNGKKVTVTANSKSGNLISLKCPFYRLSVQFSDQKPYAEQSASEDGGLITANDIGSGT